MKRRFMVRILRSSDEEYVDMVVDAESEDEAKSISLCLVKANPFVYFGEPDEPAYYVDPTSDVEDVTGGEYDSANEVRP